MSRVSQLNREKNQAKGLKKWFGNRMPISDSVILAQRSTYILPTKAGFFLFAIIILMMIGATNYQNNLAFLLTFFIAGIGLVSILFTFRNLQGLVFERGLIESVCVGEQLKVTVFVKSQNHQQHMTIGVGFDKHQLYFVDVNADVGNSIVLPIEASSRGAFQVPRIRATSSFPFGLLQVWTWFRFETPVVIYPKPIEPIVVAEKGEQSEEDGANIVSGNDDLYGLKTYQSGDPVSRIDWKALARERGLFTKEFVAYQSQDLIFDWNNFRAVNQELRLSYLCYLVLQASHANLEYSLVMPNKVVGKNSGETHRRRCLELLGLFDNEGES